MMAMSCVAVLHFRGSSFIDPISMVYGSLGLVLTFRCRARKWVAAYSGRGASAWAMEAERARRSCSLSTDCLTGEK